VNQDGVAAEREGHDRAKQRERTSREPATITIGSDANEPVGGPDVPSVEEASEEPGRDDPPRAEESLAAADASGEAFAAPGPPPTPQHLREDPVVATTWKPIVRIDAGATDDAVPGNQAVHHDEFAG